MIHADESFNWDCRTVTNHRIITQRTACLYTVTVGLTSKKAVDEARSVLGKERPTGRTQACLRRESLETPSRLGRNTDGKVLTTNAAIDIERSSAYGREIRFLVAVELSQFTTHTIHDFGFS